MTYTLRLTNTGTVDLHPTITDTLPNRVTPTGVLTWTPGVMTPGGTWEETVVVTVEEGDTRTLVNVVEATTPAGATAIYTETTSVPGTLLVTSTADSGAGTLRRTLEMAGTGDTITFDPGVFPPANPATIALTSGLPSLDDGSVTIDGSDAGVILDGSGIGTTPETVLLDDVSLTMDGGPNLIANGDFSAGLGHWRPWDDGSGATRTITTTDFHSSPDAYAWDTVAHAGQSRTVYDTTDTDEPYNDWPFDDASTAWITATGGSTAEWRFWYRGEGVYATLRVLFSDGHDEGWGYWFDARTAWSEAVVTRTLPTDAVAVALELRHNHSQNWVSGLRIGSDQNTIRGLQILNFTAGGITIDSGAQSNTIGGRRDLGTGPMGQGNLISGNGGDGIRIEGTGTDDNTITGNYIGTDVSGSTAAPNRYHGIAVLSGAQDNQIGGGQAGEGNVISGNGVAGVSLDGAGVTGNTVAGNLIGTDATGTSGLGNSGFGVTIAGGAEQNIVGGPDEADRNIISYNGHSGVAIHQQGTVSNTIQNNWIGIDADSTGGLDPRDLVVADDGRLFLADHGRGVFRSSDQATSWQGANSGLTTSEVEMVAVSPQFATTQRVWAWGDGQLFVSTDAGASWSPLSDALTGTVKALEVSPNYASDRTLLAAVEEQGIYKSVDGGVSWSQVYETSNAGSFAFSPNFASDQVVLTGLDWGGILRSTDGGNTWVESNSGLPSLGVSDLAFASDGQTVFLASDNCGNEGVYGSTDGGQTWFSSGSGLEDCGPEWQMALSPDFLSDGMAFSAEDGMYRSTDGGSTWARSGEGVFGSRAHALAFSPNFSTDGVAYFANFTGVFRTVDGGDRWTWAGANLADRGNGGDGIEINGGAGATEVISNVIGRNAYNGISVRDPDAAGTVVEGNLVGLAPDGATRAGNGSTNIRVDSPNVTVTNNACAAGGHGGLRTGTAAHHLTIRGNRFGTDKSGTIAIGNSYDGISLKSSHDTVRDNLVSGNWGAGIYASEHYTGTSSSVFAGNLIGLDASGSEALPNQGTGLVLNGSYHTVGGTSSADRNVIGSNEGYGLALRDGADHNVVSGNYIGTNLTGTRAIGNAWYGIAIYGGATGNVIGGSTAGERNVISGNDGDGIIIWGVADNTISGNYIGTDVSGLAALSNTRHGIHLGGGASQNVIGGSNTAGDACSGDCNLISGNTHYGVYIKGTGTASNTISGNYVGANVSNTAVISNAAGGIYLGDGASDNRIGGQTEWSGGVCTGTCNLIRGNGGAGVEVAGNDSLHNTVTLNSIYANESLGIDLRDGGNTELPAPVIYPSFDIEAGTASGSACAGCTVHLFSDAHGEGRQYEGSAVADENGEWSIEKESGFAGPEITALATDVAGNTSEFGQDWPPDPPPPPVFAAPVCGVTNQPQPTFAGTAQMGSSVKVGTGGQLLGETTTDDWNRWSLTPGTALTDATHLITSTATTVWGTSDEAGLTLTVDSGLCYNPVGVTFVQRGVAQHPRDTAGCVDPANDLEVVLWPSEPVTVRVPVKVPTATVYVEVNNIEYDLTDSDSDGVFTGQFTAPDSGNPVILLIIERGDQQRIMRIGSTIDPEGYVYDAKLTERTGVTQTMAGVTVTLYVSDTVRNRWVQWNAPLYNNQINPQMTGKTGHFSFFTPPGTYRLVAEKEWYYPFTSPDLVVVDEPVRYNIPLVKIPAPDSLEKYVTPTESVDYGDEITYTLVVSADRGAEVGIYDPLTDTTFLRFVEQPSGITHTNGVITGGTTVTPTHYMTVSFAARVDAPGTLGWTSEITNRACVYPAWRTREDCIWSEVSNTAVNPYDVGVEKSVISSDQVEYGEEITYTLTLAAAPGTQVALYDPLPGTALTRFLEQPGSVTYKDGVVTGTVEITSTDYVTVSFVASVEVPITPGATVIVTNSAQACPVSGTSDDCVWSNEVTNDSFRPNEVYLPSVLRSHATP